jgi:hypothetical protein
MPGHTASEARRRIIQIDQRPAYPGRGLVIRNLHTDIVLLVAGWIALLVSEWIPLLMPTECSSTSSFAYRGCAFTQAGGAFGEFGSGGSWELASSATFHCPLTFFQNVV